MKEEPQPRGFVISVLPHPTSSIAEAGYAQRMTAIGATRSPRRVSAKDRSPPTRPRPEAASEISQGADKQ
jgi:hypothetical protein